MSGSEQKTDCRRIANRRRACRAWLAACMLVGTSGCANVPAQPTHRQSVQRQSVHRQSIQRQDAVAQFTGPHNAGPHNAGPQTKIPRHFGRTSHSNSMANEVAANGTIAQVVHEEPISCQDTVAHDACLNDGACGICGPVETGPVPPYWNDQEYLYDGGDREPTVQVTEDWRVSGLDSQDTVAHYETIEGKLCVAASNRVPIYAPRFGAVRKVTTPYLAARAAGAERIVDPTGAVVRRNDDPTRDIRLPTAPKNQSTVKLIDALHERTRGVPAQKITPTVDMSSMQAALARLQENDAVVRREDLMALVDKYTANARTWNHTDYITVSMGGVEARQTRDAKRPQDVTLYETEPGKCSLRICKAASHSAASPGDVVQFAIRFDNFGEKPIGNLVILDSLTTRLEYIDGSQQCLLSPTKNEADADKDAPKMKFSTAENDAGSTVLRWEADSPLVSGDGGVITFRCRVR